MAAEEHNTRGVMEEAAQWVTWSVRSTKVGKYLMTPILPGAGKQLLWANKKYLHDNSAEPDNVDE